MSFSSILHKVTPWIATAASIAVPGAAPLIGIAAKCLTAGLGTPVKATPDDISAAITAAMGDPAQAAKLKQIDDDFAVQMQQLGFQQITDLAQIDAADRANARDMQKTVKSWIPATLAIAVTVGFFGLLAMMLLHRIPPESAQVVDIMVGTLGTAWIGIINYYFGSSSGSATKTALLAQTKA